MSLTDTEKLGQAVRAETMEVMSVNEKRAFISL